MKKNIIIIILLVIILVIGYLYWTKNNTQSPMIPGRDGGSGLCTREAKLCPDGSYVERTGPNCEFADCPTTN
jgi:uncharacterized protein YpmB